MNKQFVNSRGVKWIRYDPFNRTLDVEYASTRAYRYFGVEPDVYEWLLKVPSKGRFVARLVKSNYRYEPIDPDSTDVATNDLEELLRESLGSKQKDEDQEH